MATPEQQHEQALERFLDERPELRIELDNLNPLLAQAKGETQAQFREERLHEAFEAEAERLGLFAWELTLQLTAAQCHLNGLPFLSPDNDTRTNLALLLAALVAVVAVVAVRAAVPASQGAVTEGRRSGANQQHAAHGPQTAVGGGSSLSART